MVGVAHGLTQGEAIQPGHQEIDDQEVRKLVFEQRQGLLPVGRQEDHQVEVLKGWVGLKGALKNEPGNPVILCDEYFDWFRHGLLG